MVSTRSDPGFSVKGGADILPSIPKNALQKFETFWAVERGTLVPKLPSRSVTALVH